MRATMESLGILRCPMTWGAHSACTPAGFSAAAAGGVSCRPACAQSVDAGNTAITAAARSPTVPRTPAMRGLRERVRTDFSLLLPRKLPLTRFTVKIRTPSLQLKNSCWNLAPAGSLGEVRLYGSDGAQRE